TRRVGRTCRAVVAEEFHVTAKRNGGDFPARAVPVVKADDFGAKTDRKHQNPNAAPAGDQEMAQLMEEYDQAEDEQERHDIAEESVPKRLQMRHNHYPHDARRPRFLAPDTTY